MPALSYQRANVPADLAAASYLKYLTRMMFGMQYQSEAKDLVEDKMEAQKGSSMSCPDAWV
ncbi:MAG: hypothetical protein NVS3B14_08270 [Ktedonobacteraceae bacterium]